MNRTLRRAGAVAALTTLLLPCLPAHAQFKIVEPDGRVTYTDRPTADARPLRVGGGQSGASAEALPFELRQPAARFPVVLYTSANCGPCDQARSYLRQRGIPFTEKTVSTPADAKAWEQLALGGEVPVLRIGQQLHRGFLQSVVATDLDLAGYPTSSKLPASYRGWEPSSLAVAAPAPPAPPPKRADPPPPRPEPTPGGIRF